MPDLTQSLQGRDLGHLRIVAELWGVEISAPDAHVAFQRLIPSLLNARRVAKLIESLPPSAAAALQHMLGSEGRLPWSQFTRRYGAIREMGAARRDRERPHLNPVSPAEALFYRALVGKAFFDTPHGPVEFAYIPEDLLPLLPLQADPGEASLGRPATPVERAQPHPAYDRLLDHATTLLAGLRAALDQPFTGVEPGPWLPPLTLPALRGLLQAAGLLDETGLPQPEPTRLFLEAPRGEALAILARAWLGSDQYNELRLIPHLRAEGDWKNDPLSARRLALDFLSTIPAATWWSLPAFINAVRSAHPDFQRPAGDYDSWFIRDTRTGDEAAFLRGFDHWDEVDGELLRYLICGPLYWLGAVELASPAPEAPPAAFRLSARAAALLAGKAPAGLPVEDALILVRSDARLIVPRLAPRSARYQAARFCSWQGEKDGEYTYRLTPASLSRARLQGLNVSHLLNLFKRYAKPVPPSLLKALERWEAHGSEARFEKLLVLRLASPDALQAVRASRAARFLGDPLGPTSITVKAGALEKVLAVLAEMGYLGDASSVED